MHETLWHSLLTWYGQNQRDLPWRRTHDPYAILVSETMLQQTGVERVIPMYHAFLAELPTLRALTQAPTADVIRLWAGLGYNRRAVWLQRAARAALERWGGLPSAIDDLLSLPGIGPYTARAVACFTFAAHVPVCDTNIRRVLTRVLHGSAETRLSEKQMLALAKSVLPPERAYDWNQALMDLGATVCTHAAPRCLICPLQAICRAYPAVQTPPPVQAAVTADPKPRWKETRFAGSRRYYRGRIVHYLRQLEPGRAVTLAELGPHIKQDYTEADKAWLEDLVAQLVRDGLAQLNDAGEIALPA